MLPLHKLSIEECNSLLEQGGLSNTTQRLLQIQLLTTLIASLPSKRRRKRANRKKRHQELFREPNSD